MPRKPKVESIKFKDIEIKAGQTFGNCDLVALVLSELESTWPMRSEIERLELEILANKKVFESDALKTKSQTPSSANQSESVQPVCPLLADKEQQPTNMGTDSIKDSGSSHNLGPSSPSSDFNLQGQAGEHLVMADLLLNGVDVYQASPALPYDLLADLGGRFVRIQVKTCRAIKHESGRGEFYEFKIRTGNKKRYEIADFELLALVGLETKQIAYLPNENTRTVVRLSTTTSTPGKTGREKLFGNIDQYPFTQALKDLAA